MTPESLMIHFGTPGITCFPEIEYMNLNGLNLMSEPLAREGLTLAVLAARRSSHNSQSLHGDDANKEPLGSMNSVIIKASRHLRN
jgi:hypothetical protein